MRLLKMLGFGKETPPPTPLWETNFKEWAKTADEGQLTKYVDTLGIDEDNLVERNFTNNGWGHSFNTTEKLSKEVTYGHGFDSASGMLMSKNGRLKKGHVMLMNTESGKLGQFLVLDIEFKRDPNDMFFAYIVCIGYKEEDKA